MCTYKLTYINARGRGELIRLIFAQTGQEYDDCRVSLEQVAEEKQKSPYGVLPVLNVDDKVLSGNGTIARYLAEKNDLAGTNEIENAEIYSIIDALEVLWERLVLYFYERDDKKKSEIRKLLTEKMIPFALAKFEKQITENNCTEGWMYGNKFTYADFAIFALVDVLNDHIPGMVNNFPHVQNVADNVTKLSKIAEWLTRRPQTSH